MTECAIRFHPNAEQLALAQTIDDSLADLLPLSRLHQADDEDSSVWSALHDMGLFAVALPESRGGSNLGNTEEALIALALGRHLAAPSVLAMMGGAGLFEAATGSDTPRLAAAFDDGAQRIVVGGRHARHALVRSAHGTTVQEYVHAQNTLLDSHAWACELHTLTGAGRILATLDSVQEARLRLLDAAALAGIAQTALQMSVAYALSRQQFGRAIGSFQAIQHHCANMASAARCARDQTTFAAVGLDDDRTDAVFQVESALYVAGRAALDNAALTIQIHGGFGFSDEADPHLLLKRARVLLALAGGLEASLARLAEA